MTGDNPVTLGASVDLCHELDLDDCSSTVLRTLLKIRFRLNKQLNYILLARQVQFLHTVYSKLVGDHSTPIKVSTRDEAFIPR